MIRTLKSAREGSVSSPAKEPAARTARALARGPSAIRTRDDEFFTFAVIGAALAGAFLAAAVVAIAGAV